MNREAMYAALFALGQGAAGFAHSARRLRLIHDLQPAEFPAFYQVQVEENWAQPRGNLPSIGELRAEWWVYVYSSDPAASHAALLNPLVDALSAAAKLPPFFNAAGAQTLGGLVTGVHLDGAIQYAEGALEDRAFARIPLVIKTA